MGCDFKKGDLVVYSTNGVCVLEDIREMNLGGDTHMYYILRPKSNGGSTVFIPCDNEVLTAKLRYVLTKDEIDEILRGVKKHDIDWIADRRARGESFREIMVGGVRGEMLSMIRCLYQRRRELAEQSKRLSSTDEGFLKTAEKLVSEELGFALGIPASDVGDYIRSVVDM